MTAPVLKFRPTTKTRYKRQTASEKREARSEAHMALICRLWCVITSERSKIFAHTLRCGPARQERGSDADNRWVLPVSRAMQNRLNGLGSRNELAFFDEHGVNPYDLAAALWAATGDVLAMSKVLEQHQDAARNRVSRRRGSKYFRPALRV